MAWRVRRQPADAHGVLRHGVRSPRALALLDTLFERDAGAALPLPEPLVARYGGALAFPARRPYVVANFVATIDGVVSYAIPGQEAAGIVSGGNEADRFVLALLRACADAIVVGAGTLRRERDHIWTPEFVYPEGAAEFATLRGAMRKPRHAEVVFVSASGDVDRTAPIFRAGVPVRVVTGKRGAGEIVAAAGGGLIVCEGGPTLLGVFVGERALDELFLTTAARLAGRARDARRPALLEEHAFPPEDSPGASLLSLKRSGDFVFSRYRFTATMSRAAPG